ncbi:MAG: HDOD domain-containing protein [Desulfobacterales bacterium]|nr:HDOD domain-containing protein [Desulfobacterales bacterium]
MSYQAIEHIAAGQFKAARERREIYQAYLATCVGVALYDQTVKAGGIIHILLPEPPGVSPPLFPEKYASTGIPMLIKELLDAGATPENIKATIAGGALVGPVSRQDINLDIGGRTTDIAMDVLKKAGIKTIKSETGGFFTCTLELDMATGDTRIKPAWDIDRPLSKPFSTPTEADIKTTIDQLKPIPQTALKILRMFQSNAGDISDIAGVLGKDQVLSAKTLKICNSAVFSGTVKIDSLKDAVLLMGENLLIKSVITAAVQTYYNQTGSSGYSLCKGGLFFHAVGVAKMADIIAERCEISRPELAYTAGLLHDIGKVVLDQYVAESTPLFFRQIIQEHEDFINSEKKLLGITHCEAGSMLANQWNFSDSLKEIIHLHHSPMLAEKNKDLVYTIYLSDLLIEKFGPGLDLEKTQTRCYENALNHLGLKPADLPELLDEFPLNVFTDENF